MLYFLMGLGNDWVGFCAAVLLVVLMRGQRARSVCNWLGLGVAVECRRSYVGRTVVAGRVLTMALRPSSGSY